MKLIDKLEKKFGKYAIPNLMLYVVVLYAVGFVVQQVDPMFYYTHLSLNAASILQGEVWRIVTFLILPPSTSLIFLLFSLYLYYVIGRELEYVWGSFRFNLYFFTGILLHVIAAFLTYAITDVSFPMGIEYINLSLFFAYASIYPNQQFLLFGVLPIKVKYLAWIDAAYFAYAIIQAFLPAYGGGLFGVLYIANAISAFVSILNFLIFFFMTRKHHRYSPKEMKRKRAYKQAVKTARENQVGKDGARHRCAVCGRTELDDPNLEFRYCSKCNGNYEYCQDHLFTHEHVK